ncbi:MAG: NAD(P)/FAD-dependent oxidoreductase [Thermodesulfobacteriota bacterium]
MTPSCDLVIVGAGSVGVPAALACARSGLSVVVLDFRPSPGQGEHKKAIGGVRATHSEKGKVVVCTRSIQIFSSWLEETGDDILWAANGYSYPAYRENEEKTLKSAMDLQIKNGADVQWLTPEDYRLMVPGIRMEGLRGAIYSRGDGSASPLLFMTSVYRRAVEAGVRFRFNQRVTGFVMDKSRVSAVRTDQGTIGCGAILNAAGAAAREVSLMAGVDIPVRPDCHEALVTEPVAPFMGPMVVDMRPVPGSRNFYFYQNREGHVIACLTPDPPLWGTDSRSTSGFLPLISRRMIELMPMLAPLKIRRSWRGLYPMTPDGFPIFGKAPGLQNYFLSTGMCGQGFMIGPGLGETFHRLLSGGTLPEDEVVLSSFSPNRDFSGHELFA